MIESVGVLVKVLDGRNVISLALSPSANDLCSCDRARSFLQLRRGWRRPDGMVVADGNAPVSHAASRVSDGNFGKCLFSIFILERMEPGDRPIELLLGDGGTGDWEIDSSKFL